MTTDEQLENLAKDKKSSLLEIFKIIFAVNYDAEGNLKENRLTKANLELLIKDDSSEPLNTQELELLIKDIKVTDPSLSLLADIVAQSIGSGKCKRPNVIIDLAVSISSQVWINHHSGFVNLFENLLSSYAKENYSLENLQFNINNQYEARLRGTSSKLNKLLKEAKSDIEQNVIDLKIEEKTVSKQKESILTIGFYWLLITQEFNIDNNIDFLLDFLYQGKDQVTNTRNVLLTLINQTYKSDKTISQALHYLHAKERAESEKSTIFKSRIDSLNKELDEEKKSKEKHVEAIKAYEKNINELQEQLKEAQALVQDQQLDQRAKRTHLKDNERQVKATAYNLLTEEVLEPLKSALSALSLNNPDIDIASYYINFSIEKIEGALPCFKE